MPRPGVGYVMALSRSPRKVCHVLNWYSHSAFLFRVSYWSSHPLPVLWVKITLPHAADEEVRKYPGHCRAKIRLRACPPFPNTGECLCARPHVDHASYIQPRGESYGSFETAALLSHFTEKENQGSEKLEWYLGHN